MNATLFSLCIAHLQGQGQGLAPEVLTHAVVFRWEVARCFFVSDPRAPERLCFEQRGVWQARTPQKRAHAQGFLASCAGSRRVRAWFEGDSLHVARELEAREPAAVLAECAAAVRELGGFARVLDEDVQRAPEIVLSEETIRIEEEAR